VAEVPAAPSGVYQNRVNQVQRDDSVNRCDCQRSRAEYTRNETVETRAANGQRLSVWARENALIRPWSANSATKIRNNATRPNVAPSRIINGHRRRDIRSGRRNSTVGTPTIAHPETENIAYSGNRSETYVHRKISNAALPARSPIAAKRKRGNSPASLKVTNLLSRGYMEHCVRLFNTGKAAMSR
jgi:hypothetical protein